MSQLGFERLMAGRPTSSAPDQDIPLLAEAVVTRSDAAGVFVTEDGGSTQTPLGPVLGGRRRAGGSSCPSGAHTHPLEQLPVGTRVLLARPPGCSPWIVRFEE